MSGGGGAGLKVELGPRRPWKRATRGRMPTALPATARTTPAMCGDVIREGTVCTMLWVAQDSWETARSSKNEDAFSKGLTHPSVRQNQELKAMS